LLSAWIRCRIPDAPVGRSRARVDGGRVPGPATTVHLWIAPQVAILDSVERPLDDPRLLIEGIDDAHLAPPVETRDARTGGCTQVERAVVGGELLVNSLDVRMRNLPGPELTAGRGVERGDRFRTACNEHLALVNRH